MSDHPAISLCLIVKNEEQFLARCLESVQGLVSEIIICDTGSTDRSLDIAREFGAKIFSIPWNDDFSAARNLSLAEASHPWILVLDGDEALDSNSQIILRELSLGQPACYYLERKHYYNDVPSGETAAGSPRTPWGDLYVRYSETKDLRFFPNDKRIHFSGRIHEGIEGLAWGHGFETKPTEALIHHFGTLKGEVERERKVALYLELSAKKWAEAKMDWKAATEYAEALREYGQADKGLEIIETLVHLNPLHAEFWYFKGYLELGLGQFEASISSFERAIRENICFHPAYTGLGIALTRLGHFEVAAICLREATRLNANDPNIWLQLGAATLAQGLPEQALQHFSKALELVPGYLPALSAIEAMSIPKGGD